MRVQKSSNITLAAYKQHTPITPKRIHEVEWLLPWWLLAADATLERRF
jgi:hypothetical protein